MKISYFKRFKMEIDLADAPPVPMLPEGFAWIAWEDALVEAHAEVKFHCFQDEIDATVFPSLGNRTGCHNLMGEIRRKQGFLSAATWLITGPSGNCGTVQGVRERYGLGAIQNLGVTPSHRGCGLGSALLLKALEGFRRAGLQRAFLEVTAQNDAAVRLYRRLGFRCRKTVYKAVEQTAGALTM
ncbi:MAG: N-acetyltransferase [Gemmataceae bacterium]|nr:N-acetyltransferase [Gemmataceae bacterium]